jgi:hypothetical protein
MYWGLLNKIGAVDALKYVIEHSPSFALSIESTDPNNNSISPTKKSTHKEVSTFSHSLSFTLTALN